MQTIRLVFTALLVFIASVSFASEDPKFIVEDNGTDYTMYLQLEDLTKVKSVVVEGNYTKDGVIKDLVIDITKYDLAVANDGMAVIHTLENDYDMANYVVKIYDTAGNILEYPLVQISLSDMDVNLAVAE